MMKSKAISLPALPAGLGAHAALPKPAGKPNCSPANTNMLSTALTARPIFASCFFFMYYPKADTACFPQERI